MADSEGTDWDALGEFARRRQELDPHLLRGALANALRNRGYGAIAAPEDGNGEELQTQTLPALLALTVLWSFGVSGAIALGAPWYLWPIGILIAFAIVGVLSQNVSSDSTGTILLLSWAALGLVQAVSGGFETFLITYLAPLGIAVAYGLATRALRLRDAQDFALALGGVVKSAPLVAPVVLVVLFLPALSADVWQVADELSISSLLIIAVASVGLLFVVVRLQLGSETEMTVERRARSLCDYAKRSELTRRHLERAEQESVTLLESTPEATVDEAWPAEGEEYGPYLNAAVGKTLRSPLTGRLALTVGIVGLLFIGYIYILCTAVVPVELAAEWTGNVAPSAHIEVPGVSITLYGGAFLKLAVLLGLAATATFLSFALIEERFAKALAGALLQDPTDRLLVLALPYVALWEKAIEEGRAARQAPSS